MARYPAHELVGMTDPDVTLTDYGLALLCACLVWRLWRGPRFGPARFWLVLFFAAAGAAPLFGGTVHGFFDLEGTTGHAVLWPATLIAIGVAAFAAWGLGARLVLKKGAADSLIGLGAVVFLGYSGLVIMGYQDFPVAVIHYLPATLFLLIAMLIRNHRAPHPGFRLGAIGMILTFAAAAVQQLQLGVHPVWFNHNAVYHLVQAAAFILIYRGMVGALRS